MPTSKDAISDCSALSSKLETCPKPVDPLSDRRFKLAICYKKTSIYIEFYWNYGSPSKYPPFETQVNGNYRVDHLQENQKERLSLLITPRLLM